MSIFDTGITDTITKAVESTSKIYADAIVEGFEIAANIIVTKLQDIEDNKNGNQ